MDNIKIPSLKNQKDRLIHELTISILEKYHFKNQPFDDLKEEYLKRYFKLYSELETKLVKNEGKGVSFLK